MNQPLKIHHYDWSGNTKQTFAAVVHYVTVYLRAVHGNITQLINVCPLDFLKRKRGSTEKKEPLSFMWKSSHNTTHFQSEACEMQTPKAFSYKLAAFYSCPSAVELRAGWFIDNMVKCCVSSCYMWRLVNCSADKNPKLLPFQYIVWKHMFQYRCGNVFLHASNTTLFLVKKRQQQQNKTTKNLSIVKC